MLHKTVLGIAGAAFFLGAFIMTAEADHSWGGYHWARIANPFTLKVGDNVSSAWDSYLRTSESDWSVSTVLDLSVVTGQANPKTCKAVKGRVEVCNSKYGKNGWLGIASVWVSGSHITQGAVKLNDTYYNTTTYNTPAWRNLVMCQEIGHTLGLDHQDEAFDNPNLGTCMDYTSDPSTNQHPNQHDYDMLEEIYAHVDGVTTLAQSLFGAPAEIGNDRGDWGKEVRKSKDGKTSLFAKELKKGEKVFTFVVWAE